jgi:O-antigen/teichoic acid export membrane protein
MTRGLAIDLLVNYGSLAIVAVCGLLVNLVVGRALGESALGVFNQAFAVYIATSQLAVGGVHIAVLRSVAQASGQPEQARSVAAGLALSLALGTSLGTLVYSCRGLVGALLGSAEVGDALLFVGLALVPFALNKTLLATLNGLGRMRHFALLQALRVLVLLGVLSAVALRKRPASELTLALLVAELVVFCAAAPAVIHRLRLRPRDVRRDWIERHFAFGVRGLLSGVFIELNTRIDVLAIGFFLSDAEVGRYTLAAVFAEGLYQCLIVVRNQMNPVLAKLLLADDTSSVLALVRKGWRYLYPGMALTYLVGLGVLHLALTYQVRIARPGEALACYAILGAGVLAVSGFAPFDGVLLQAGRPAHYTLLTFMVALTNLLLNLALIPVLGIEGAALGTALALGISIPYLNVVMRWQLGFSYFPARARLG